MLDAIHFRFEDMPRDGTLFIVRHPVEADAFAGEAHFAYVLGDDLRLFDIGTSDRSTGWWVLRLTGDVAQRWVEHLAACSFEAMFPRQKVVLHEDPFWEDFQRA